MKGIYIPLMTPFLPNGQLATEKIDAMVEHHINQGVDGFYVGGSSSECFMMTHEERKDVFRAVAASVKHRVPLIAHVGAISLLETKMFIDCVQQEGYDAISAVPPYYYAFNKNEIMQHYRAIADFSSLPLFIYNIPNTTGVVFNHHELFELLAIENVVGIKHTTQDMFFIERLRASSHEHIIFHGEDTMLINGLQMGASGGIGSTYNLMSNQYVNIYQAMKSGDISKANELQSEANAIIEVLIEVGVYQGIKFAMAELGIDYGMCREPFAPLNAAKKEQITDKLEKIQHIWC